MWRTFCLIFLGTNVASAALLRHDQKVSRADGKVQEKDLLDMLTSLNEVVVGMDKEHKAFRDLSNARETSCRTTKAKLEKSLKDGNSSLLTAKQELSNAMSEVDSIQGGVDSIKEQVKAIDGEISGLQDQLAKLRADRQAAVARDSGYTQQVKAILEKAQQRISQVWTRSGAHKSAKSQEEESEDGASLVSLSESDQDDDPEKRTAATEGKKALAADAASVTKAAKKAREAFELQELKLLDLIKSKRQALKPLQGNLAKQQPELADQLRKISEANRSVAMTKHALKRDQKVLERSQSKCAVLSKAKKFEEDQRPQVRVQVIMAISFLKAMARKAGIDLNPGAVGPSFLQLDSKDSELSEAVRSALHHIESLDDSRYEVNFQAEASNESDDAVTVPLESNLVQVDAAQKVASSEAADSLKNVKEMIANLIASLREEQNEDQGKQKFCEVKKLLQGSNPRAFVKLPAPEPVAVIFPGLPGIEYVGMLRDVHEISSVKELLSQAKGLLGVDLLQVCLNGPLSTLQELTCSHAALYVASVAALLKLQQEKCPAGNFQVLAGLSVGEYAALAAAGVFSFQDGLSLVIQRAKVLSDAASDQATLWVTGLDEPKVRELCLKAGEVCEISGYLHKCSFTVGGTGTAVEAFRVMAKDAKALQLEYLKGWGALHTKLCTTAMERFQVELQKTLRATSPARCQVVMNATARLIDSSTDSEEVLRLLGQQLVRPVRWKESMECLGKLQLDEIYECGPKKQLKALMKRIDNDTWWRTGNVEV